METLFIQLTTAVSGSPLIALTAAALWGVLSVVLSPCHLASIPLIVGFIDGQGRLSTRRAFAISCLFAIGILLTIALIGVATAAAGRMLGDLGGWGNGLVAVVFFLFGLHLLEWLPMPWSGPASVGMTRKGLVAAFVLGLVFGVALGPCTFAFMAPILGVAFSEAAANMPYAVSLLLAYGLGHCAVIVLAGTCTELIQHYLDWNEHSRGAVILKKSCGILLLAAGGWMIYSAPL